MFLFWALALAATQTAVLPQQDIARTPESVVAENHTPRTIPSVPFYSQQKDVQSTAWRKNACGIASLAMIIGYYHPDMVLSLDTLLKRGIASGAYDKKFGWSHDGLIHLSERYGLKGERFDFGTTDTKTAFERFSEKLSVGPLIASVHYNFDPKSTIPHLVVITGIEGDIVHYNDPSAKSGNKEISVDHFLKAWKKRFIVLRPVVES